MNSSRLRDEGRRQKAEGRRQKDEGREKKEEGKGKGEARRRMKFLRGKRGEEGSNEKDVAQGKGHFSGYFFWIVTFLFPFSLSSAVALQDSSPPRNLRVVVNSNQDGAVQADESLTLREAIEIVNGTLAVDQLSSAEKVQVSMISRPDSPATDNPQLSADSSRIEFNLPADQTTIRLVDILPPLASPGLIVDGTTQPGYEADKSATAEIAIPTPVVVITPAADREVFRGFTVIADRVQIRGLSLYGFTSQPRATATLPPADIFIDSPQSEAIAFPSTAVGGMTRGASAMGNHREDRLSVPKSPLRVTNFPQGVVIENNWLGITPDERMPEQTSAFGVFVFNSQGTTIRRNRISYHEGSAIITSTQANNLQVSENIIVGNGIAGMPDAIRLEGIVAGSQINSNLICGNDGSGVYLFKPQGDVKINENQITYNGRRLRRSAVYLMGNNHQVMNNEISHQTGPGVVVAAYPRSIGNVIEANRFNRLEGLSIDLVAPQGTDVQDYQRGDGPNPKRNSSNRRRDTGNASVNAPQFISSEFFILGDQTTLYGTADPNSQVTIYRVSEGLQAERLATSQGEKIATPASTNASQPANLQTFQLSNTYGPLSEPLTTVTADDQGKFSATLETLQPGDQVSAITTVPQYGTSEPAANALITSAVKEQATPQSPIPNPQSPIPQCTSKPVPPVVQQPPEPEPEPPPAEPITIKVPTNIHFALDQSNISPESAQILDRIAQVLQENPEIVVEIQGHTDPRASDAYNQALSRRRALAARNYLLRRGIPPERMTIRALGESQLRVPGTSRLDHARNRRVEFIFQDPRGIELYIQEQDLQLEPPRQRRR